MMTHLSSHNSRPWITVGVLFLAWVFFLIVDSAQSATFYYISASAGSGGSIKPSGNVRVKAGNNQTFTITPNSGYYVSSVLVNGSEVMSSPTGGTYTYTFSKINSNHSIQAFFSKNPTITASAGSGGTISPSGTKTISYGSDQLYTITPNTGYSVISLTVDGSQVSISPTGGTYTFSKITVSHTIRAEFTQKLTITAGAGNGGSISPSGTVQVSHGSDQSFSITPSPGYSVTSVLVDGKAVTMPQSGGTYTFSNITTDHTISVTFAMNTYRITATTGEGGNIAPSGTTTVNYGTSLTYTITARSGYIIDQVTVDGTTIELVGGTYTFSNINADHTIHATFRSTGGGGGGGGTSNIPGCAASTYTNYSSGFTSSDFNMINTAVADNKIVLQTGVQAINPNEIIIPFTQEVSVTFLYEGAGYISDFGWILKSDAVNEDGSFKGWNRIASDKKHPLFIKILDDDETSAISSCCGGGDGILDSDYGNSAFPKTSESNLATYNDGTGYLFRVDQDGTVTPRDMRKTLGTFAGGTELVFFLTANKRWNTTDTDGVFFTKTSWNTDTYQACGTGTFEKIYNLGIARVEGDCSLNAGWLASPALTRLDDIFDVQLTGNYRMQITKGQKYPHVIVGAPENDQNQWILGWEDLIGAGDADHNDMVFRIDRRTGGMAQLQSANAITPSDPDAYFTAVTIEVYDSMPCEGQTEIKYFLSIDNGSNWVEILDWDFVKTFSGSGDTKSIGSDVVNWTPGTPQNTYRLRRVDFAGSALVGRQLIWKAEMTSNHQDCIPEIVDVLLTGNVATHGFFSRASPSVQTNVLYSGSYETPALTWDEKVLRGHLYATLMYDPANPYSDYTAEQATTLWDAGAVLTAMSPASRKIYFPNITVSTVTNEIIGTGDGTTTRYTGTLAHHPVSATTLTITDQYENIRDRRTDILEGDRGGSGIINRFTGEYDFQFQAPPGNGTPILATYTYYTATSSLKEFTTANVTNVMLGLDNSYIIPTGYRYDLNQDGNYTETDGDWLVGWVRGYQDGTSTKKEWLLGQIDHSVPAIQTPPGRPSWYFGTAVTDAERSAFDQFVLDNWERQTVVYVGSRDGMLHAFDAGKFRWGYLDDENNFIWGDNPKTSGDDMMEYRGYFQWSGSTSNTADYGTGSELWAFIPANLMPRLKNNLLSGEDQAYVDASPAISDVFVNGAWRTVVLSAEGNGGDTVFCLDTTNPSTPTFMWEFSDPDLFRSRSSPAVAVAGRITHNGTKKWAAFFVSGKTYDDTLYPSVYMIDIANGSVIQRIFLDSETKGIGGVPSGQPAVVDSDGNGYIDRIYIGTDKGYLYKVTIPDNPESSSGFGITECVINRDFTDNFGNSIPTQQQYHPIYASPAVVVQNEYSSQGEITYKIKILYGTGDSPYYDENINTADTTYHFFAYMDEAPKGVCNSSTVSLDWLYTLPAGHRIFASAFAAAGSVYFGTSTSETEDPCEGAANPASNAGRLYVMDIEQSGSVSPKFSQEVGNILSAPVVDDEHLYVKTVGNGLLTSPGPYNNPVIMSGLVETGVRTWQEIYRKGEMLNED